MNIVISPGSLSGTVTIPPSKSITHRALILAALAKGISKITNALFSDDTKYTIQALQFFGVKIEIDEKKREIVVHGTNGNLKKPQKPINVGNSGTTARFGTALAALTGGKTTIVGTPRLLERPFTTLINALQSQGVLISHTPRVIQVDTSGLEKLPGGVINISGNVSSQFISAFLCIAPFFQSGTQFIVSHLKSKPYVDLTIHMMKQFGVAVNDFRVLPNQHYKAIPEYMVEADFSSASYFLAAQQLGAQIRIENLPAKSIQGDSEFSKLLKKIPGIVDMSQTPDIVPTLAIIAAFTKGKTVIKNIGHLRNKESDRIKAVGTNLNSMGITTSSTIDSLTIIGGNPKGAIIETYDDHRIAMSFGIAGLFATGQTVIKNAQVVNKSYPDFWNDLKKLGAYIQENSRGGEAIPLRRWKTNLIFIGMRGSGKSTIGSQLAKNLGKDLIETDRLIEELAGKSIADIVVQNGWSYFRELEKKVCQDVCANTSNSIIATGGGMILDPENQKALQKAGLIVYLKADIKALITRVKKQNDRPLLTNASSIAQDMRAVFEKRKSIYEQTCDIELDAHQLPEIGEKTKLCAIFGNPVAHSLSPKMHNAGYQKLGLDFVFLKIKASDSQKVIETIQSLHLRGAVITIPFKQTVMKYLDHIDKTAQTIGAVNTITNNNGILTGTNTDWIGAIRALEEKTTLDGKKVALLGAGGGARAIAYGLKTKQAKIFIFNRTHKHAAKLVNGLNLEGSFELSDEKTLQNCDIIVNATSVGLNSDVSPIPPTVIQKHHIVFDIVYSPRITKLLQYAQSVGTEIITGDQMLLYQAVGQFELFTRIKAPIEIMKEVLCSDF